MNRAALGLAACILAVAPTTALAKPVRISLALKGIAKDVKFAFGPPSDLQPMSFDKNAHRYLVEVKGKGPYSLRLSHEEIPYLLPVRAPLNANITLDVRFDAPTDCVDGLVQETERPAQKNNIEQALYRYLLAVRLSLIRDEKRMCRGDQPRRLTQARRDRGSELAKALMSPFLPPD